MLCGSCLEEVWLDGGAWVEDDDDDEASSWRQVVCCVVYLPAVIN